MLPHNIHEVSGLQNNGTDNNVSESPDRLVYSISKCEAKHLGNLGGFTPCQHLHPKAPLLSLVLPLASAQSTPIALPSAVTISFSSLATRRSSLKLPRDWSPPVAESKRLVPT